MCNSNQHYVLQQIEEIINCSRYGEELFFTDCKQAATDILKFLERENILNVHESVVKIKYNVQSKAA